ncbi:hypothetical protein LTR33_013864, partial [Friedmanniomyces endolithicus]
CWGPTGFQSECREDCAVGFRPYRAVSWGCGREGWEGDIQEGVWVPFGCSEEGAV